MTIDVIVSQFTITKKPPQASATLSLLQKGAIQTAYIINRSAALNVTVKIHSPGWLRPAILIAGADLNVLGIFLPTVDGLQ